MYRFLETSEVTTSASLNAAACALAEDGASGFEGVERERRHKACKRTQVATQIAAQIAYHPSTDKSCKYCGDCSEAEGCI